MTDKVRLDWLVKNSAHITAMGVKNYVVWLYNGDAEGTGKTPRQAIDAAMHKNE